MRFFYVNLNLTEHCFNIFHNKNILVYAAHSVPIGSVRLVHSHLPLSFCVCTHTYSDMGIGVCGVRVICVVNTRVQPLWKFI